MRSSNYYEPYVFASLFGTFFFAIIVLIILAGILGKKVEKVSAKVIYFYVMTLMSLIFLSEGLAVMITMLADLVLALGKFNIDVKKAFLTCSSLLIVAAPSYFFHWSRIRKGLGLIEEEKILWPYYKYMILGISAIASLVFIGALVHEGISSLLGISIFNWDFFNKVLGYGIIGISIWLYHWFLELKFGS